LNVDSQPALHIGISAGLGVITLALGIVSPEQRLRRGFGAGAPSVAANCSSERAQKEAAEREGDESATDCGLRLLCTNVIRVSATNNGRPADGNRSSFYGLPNRRKLQAFENGLSENPNVSNATMAAHRNTLKEELLRR
jgi:hypothetical protein